MLLMTAVFLLTRVGGVHLHLCLDGMEPRVAVHMEDAELHHMDPGLQSAHHDLDVAAAGDALSKIKVDMLAALFVCLFFLPILTARRTLAAFVASQTLHISPHFLRPPLRGPPRPALI
jgi:hypothetical protein